jgi:type I restriction-modification system DNA methylase subunit
MVQKAIENAARYGIPPEVAEKNIILQDTLRGFPEILKKLKKPIFHITNPPYLYVGYIMKHNETMDSRNLFSGENDGYQDLYQIAMMNDLRNDLENLIYIIPSNFLFSASGSNKIRLDFLKKYLIKKAIVFEKKIFEHTGTNVIICFFQRSKKENEKMEFEVLKINAEEHQRSYRLLKENNFRAGVGFEEYIQKNLRFNHLKVSYYLHEEDLLKNQGENKVVLLNSKQYSDGKYSSKEFYVNDVMYKKIKSNPLFVRTVDTGSLGGRAGLCRIDEVYGVDGIFISGATYRTCPIQVFIEPTLMASQSEKLMQLLNQTLEKLREETDSEFMTTYQYSTSAYVRKYLGLSQVKDLVKTLTLDDVKTLQ